MARAYRKLRLRRGDVIRGGGCGRIEGKRERPCEKPHGPERRRDVCDGGQGVTAAGAAPAQRFSRPEHVLNLMRGRGLRVSAARRIVVATLFAAEAPVSAEQIAAATAGGGAEVDLASVYRNLETLERLGVVRHFHVGHGPGLYALAADGRREYIACERCGAVRALQPEEFDAVRAEVRSRFGFEVGFGHFPMVGVCGACGDEAGEAG
jgi:Fur family transcriptional regulator, ferric uptake regulator